MSNKTNTKKFRGSRTCGGGTTKNRRGAGNRGGRGRSGENKHHFTRALQGGYLRGSGRGFSRPLKMIRDVSVVNVGELDELADQLVEDGFAQLEAGAYSINLADLEIEKVLGKKAKEYAVNGNRYHNFDVAARVLGQTREEALMGMAIKHFVCILDMVEVPWEIDSTIVDEKIGDMINYLILLEGMLLENKKK